jgi:hypothetical protein
MLLVNNFCVSIDLVFLHIPLIKKTFMNSHDYHVKLIGTAEITKRKTSPKTHTWVSLNFPISNLSPYLKGENTVFLKSDIDLYQCLLT